jgi:hypothetical protein
VTSYAARREAQSVPHSTRLSCVTTAASLWGGAR